MELENMKQHFTLDNTNILDTRIAEYLDKNNEMPFVTIDDDSNTVITVDIKQEFADQCKDFDNFDEVFNDWFNAMLKTLIKRTFN